MQAEHEARGSVVRTLSVDTSTGTPSRGGRVRGWGSPKGFWLWTRTGRFTRPLASARRGRRVWNRSDTYPRFSVSRHLEAKESL